MAIAKLIVVRHGATEWSASGKHTSHTDIDLTEAGRTGARALREWLQAQRPAQVWSSPLRRARATAHECGFAEVELVDALHEWDYGEYEGLTTADIHRRDPDWSVFTHGGGSQGESPAQVSARIDTLIARAQAADAAPIVAFAHGHSLRALAVRWMGLPIEAGARLSLGPAHVGLLDFEHGLGALAGWNLSPDSMKLV